MKKLISVLLALLMLFSTATVAFAAEGDAAEPETTVAAEDEAEADDNILKDMDTEDIMGMLEGMSWTEIKFALKVAKIAVKLILVLDKLGFVDLSPIKNAILDVVWDLIKDYVNQNQTEENTTDADVTEAPAA